MNHFKSFLLGCLFCLLICGLSALLGVNKYVESINRPLIDSLENVKAINEFKLDSLNGKLDSLKYQDTKHDTVYINLIRNEETSINNVDSLHVDSLKKSVINLLRY